LATYDRRHRAGGQQESLFKLNLWFGRTLWECSSGTIKSRSITLQPAGSGQDAYRRHWHEHGQHARLVVGCGGRSASPPRVGVACLTRYENLIKHGQLRAHGVYYFVYGLLKHFDSEGVIALIAPRPYLALTGDLDSGRPPTASRSSRKKFGASMRRTELPSDSKSVLYPDIGHTPTRRKLPPEMLAWFEQVVESQIPSNKETNWSRAGRRPEFDSPALWEPLQLEQPGEVHGVFPQVVSASR